MAPSRLKLNPNFEENHQSWVTTVLSDEEAIQAIALAISLKKVGTSRMVSVLISDDLSQNMK